MISILRKKSFHKLFLTLFIFLTGCKPQAIQTTLQLSQPESEFLSIEVDPSHTYQVIESFGVSGAWWAQEVGGWQADNRQKVIDLLFDPIKGIGLTLYRYNIGAGGGGEIQDYWRKTEGFEIGPRIYDWRRDANATRILKMVHAAGIDQFVAFANSPPSRLTRSGMVSGSVDGESNLGLYQEEEFAQYLVDIVRYLRQELGIPIGWISPINEPQWEWNLSNGQEGCHYTPEETAALVYALQEAITKNGLEVKVLAPESAKWSGSQVYIDALYQNFKLFSNLDQFAIHSYWSTPEEKEQLAGYIRETYPGVRLWMTEWTEMQPGRDTGTQSAIVLARTIHEDLTLGGVTSWQYWIGVSKYDFHDGLIYIDQNIQKITETKRLWAMGNYSRFIRPGWKLILAKVTSPGLLVSAYTPPQGQSLVIVAINILPQSQEATLKINGPNWFHMSAYETSETKDLAQVALGTLPERYSFPGNSVTTLVIQP